MKRAGIMMMGLLLPLGQAWSVEGEATPGWQVTPFFGYSSAIDFEANDDPQPTPVATRLESLQGERS
ncbi:porin family protein, partial [Aeromonas caviae]